MKRFLNFVCILCMLLFVACLGDDNKNEGGNITMTPAQKENLSQQVGASDTEAKSVTFTTTDAWSSSIKAVRSTDVEWVKITPDHGDAAGTYTVAITFDANETGKERQAQIIISCGETKITILIEQSADDNTDDDDDDEPTVGNKPIQYEFPGPKIKSVKQYSLTAEGELNKLMSSYSFVYEDDLLKEVTQRWSEDEYDYEKYSFTYPKFAGDNLVMKCDQWMQVNSTHEYIGYENVMEVNEKGQIISFYQPGYEDEIGTLEYDDDQLVRLNDADGGGYTEYSWNNWNMVSQKLDETGNGEYVRTHSLKPSTLHSNPFWYSQVDPTVMCQEEISILLPWSWGFTGGHNQSLYDSISAHNGTEISFAYEFDGEQKVMGNNVALISRVTTTYKMKDNTQFRECYLFEYYTK